MSKRKRKVGSGRSARSEAVSTKPAADKSESIKTPSGFLRFVARGLLLALVAIGPWFYAMATWESQLMLAVISGILLLLSIAAAKSNPGGGILHRCLAVLILVALIQTIPLPAPLYGLLSANSTFQSQVETLSTEFETEITPAAAENAKVEIEEVPFPSTISIAPEQSRAALAVLASALAILWSSTLIMHTMRWQALLLAVVAISGSANAALGIIQSLAGEWTLLPNLSGQYFSTFVNRNSAPQFYAIGLGATLALIVWWFGTKGSSVVKKYSVHYPAVNMMARLRRRIESLVSELDVVVVLLLLTVVVFFAAIFATASRGGILACGLATLIIVIRLLGDYRASFLAIVVLAGSLLGVLLLSFLGIASETGARLSTLSEEFHQLSNVRILLWGQAISRGECWLLGSGHGTFHLAVLTCDLPVSSSTWYYHAENLYVETIVTFGIVVFLATFAAICLFIYDLMTHAQKKNVAHIAVLPAVCAISVQSVVDFSLILPGIFLPLLALIGCIPQDRKPPIWSRISSVERFATFLLVLAAIAYGLPSLYDFSRAELIARATGLSLTSNTDFEVARQETAAIQRLRFPSRPNGPMRWMRKQGSIFLVPRFT